MRNMKWGMFTTDGLVIGYEDVAALAANGILLPSQQVVLLIWNKHTDLVKLDSLDGVWRGQGWLCVLFIGGAWTVQLSG